MIMNAYDYNENQLVEQPAIELFAELGWTTVCALEETFGCAEPSLQASPSGRGDEEITGCAGPIRTGELKRVMLIE